MPTRTLRGRFDQALAAAREALATLQTERAAREQRQKETAEKVAARRALIARCRGMGGDTSAEAQAVLVAEWEGLPVVDHPEGAQLQADFESALRSIERKRQDETSFGERLGRIWPNWRRRSRPCRPTSAIRPAATCVNARGACGRTRRRPRRASTPILARTRPWRA